MGSRVLGLQALRLSGSRSQALQLWHMDLVAVSSWSRLSWGTEHIYGVPNHPTVNQTPGRSLLRVFVCISPRPDHKFLITSALSLAQYLACGGHCDMTRTWKGNSSILWGSLYYHRMALTCDLVRGLGIAVLAWCSCPWRSSLLISVWGDHVLS